MIPVTDCTQPQSRACIRASRQPVQRPRHAQSAARPRGLCVRAPRAAALDAGPGVGTGVQGAADSHETDVVVIGAGVGGLSCGGLLAKYGLDVTVLESHTVCGGAAHAWQQRGYHFESGPSLYSGMASTGKAGNPLSHVLQAVGEPLDLIEYDQWNVILPEGEFLTRVGADSFVDVLQQVRGPAAVAEWRRLQEFMRPYAAAASVVPATAIRSDAAVLATTAARYGGALLASGGKAAALVKPFSELIEGVVKDPFIRNWLDLLCFLLSGLPAKGTIAAEVAFMFNEWYKPNSCLEFPRGGSQAMVDALARGVTKRGGRVHTRSHVEQVLLEEGRAAGVRLRGGATVRARRAVVTNATLWDARRLLPEGAFPGALEREVESMPVNRSFMHLHLGFDASGLEGLHMHHIVVGSWEGGVDTEQNVVLISIASVADPGLAPEGKHSLHAYYPATEPYGLWAGLDRKSDEYAALKKERSQALWRAVERVIPDIHDRIEISKVGSPLTQERYLRRHKGSYGPGIVAGTGTFPGCKTPVPGLLACGDSTFPGIGLPAVAASGAIAANSLVPVWDHMRLLDELGL